MSKTTSAEGVVEPGEPLLFETVAAQVLHRYGRRWKPSTQRVNRIYLRNQILPYFRGAPVAGINPGKVRQWFGTLHKTPAAANRSLPILSLILREAESLGHRPLGTNPCKGIRRYPERRRNRFLTPPEVERLGRVLEAHASVAPAHVAIVRLLLLTGCRQSEIRTLRWADYRGGHIFLREGKTGPRTVWLSNAARRLIGTLPRKCRYAFPAPSGQKPTSTETLYRTWRRVRTEAALPGLRLHDLRHSYASFGLQSGESVVVIGRLLGHRDPATTLRYTHFGDDLLRDAVESVAAALGR